jgi:hypothetical protein
MTNGGRNAAALIALLGGNAVPVIGLVNRGWPPLDGMLMYLADNVLMVLATALAVRMFAPRYAPEEQGGRRRSELVNSFLLVALPFSFGAAVFIVFFAFLRHSRFGPDFLWGLATMAVFQLLGFVWSSGVVRDGGMPASEVLMEKALGRVFLLSVTVYLGIGLAMFVDAAFAVPFVLLKTLVDLGRIPAIFRPNPTAHGNPATLN